MLNEATSLSERARVGGFISRENLGDLGFCYLELGDSYRELANRMEAAQAYRRACETFRLTVGRSVKERKGRLAWAGCHAAQAELEGEQNHREAAIAQYRDAISVLQSYRETHSADQQLQHQLDAYQAKLAELTETTPVPR
jgi:tetratricopeptide (TPR) repeat protein